MASKPSHIPGPHFLSPSDIKFHSALKLNLLYSEKTSSKPHTRRICHICLPIVYWLPCYITHVHAYTLHTSPHCTYTHISLTQLTHPPPCTHITNTYEGSPGKACFLSWLTSLGTPLVKATLGRPLPCLLSQRLVRVGSGEHSVLAGSESM